MKKLYGRISALKNFVNDTFSVRLWMAVTATFFEIVFIVFLLVLYFQYWDDEHLSIDWVLKSGYIHLITIKATFFILKLVITVKTCESLEFKEMETGIVLHQTFSNDLDFHAKTEVSINRHYNKSNLKKIFFNFSSRYSLWNYSTDLKGSQLLDFSKSTITSFTP